VALGQVFSKYFSFPCQFLFQLLRTHHLSSGTGTIGQLLANVPSGLTLTSTQEREEKERLRVAESSMPSLLWVGGLCLPALKGSCAGSSAFLLSWKGNQTLLRLWSRSNKRMTVRGLIIEVNSPIKARSH
jgi:hypothetical protein